MSWLLLAGLAATAQAQGLTAFPVCIRPPDVPADIDAWAYAPNGTMVMRMKRDEFKKESRGQMVYLLTPSAPQESVKLLPIRWHGLKCPPYMPPPKPPPPAPPAMTAPPPSPLPGAGAQPEAPRPAAKPPAAVEKKKQAPAPPPPMLYVNRPPPPEPVPRPPPGGATEHWPKTVLPVAHQAPGAQITVLPATPLLPVVRREDTERLPMAHVLPMKGAAHGSGTAAGDGTGTGPKKTLIDKIAKELAYAGAIANLQLNEDTRRPDGKPYGIVGGKSEGGPNHPAAQAAAGAVMVAAVVLSANSDNFIKKAQALYKKAVEKGEAKLATLAFKDLEELGEKGAEELAKLYGADIARAIQQNGAIGPYAVMKKFTDKLGGAYQAHHLLEKKFARDFGLGNADKIPSVILSDAQHKLVTAELKVATGKADTAQKLWAGYQKAYADHPDWLKAIESYFVKGK